MRSWQYGEHKNWRAFKGNCWWCGKPAVELVQLISPDGHTLEVHKPCEQEARAAFHVEHPG